MFLINHAGILENLKSNMGQKSALNGIFDPFRTLGSVRNGLAAYFSSRLSPSKPRTASKWSQNGPQERPFSALKGFHRLIRRTSGRLLGPIWADRAPQDAPREPRGTPRGPTAQLLGCKMVAQGLPTQQKTGRDETKTRQDKTNHDNTG